MKVLIVYYSTYGHVHKMAEAIAEGYIRIALTHPAERLAQAMGRPELAEPSRRRRHWRCR